MAVRLLVIEAERAERRATIGQRPMVLGRHGQSAGTARVRPQFAKPARIPSGDRSVYSPNEGLTRRAERRAARKPARIPSGDRSVYSPDEGLT